VFLSTVGCDTVTTAVDGLVGMLLKGSTDSRPAGSWIENGRLLVDIIKAPKEIGRAYNEHD